MLARAAAIIAEGEVYQLAKAGDLTATQDDYIKIIHAKTATLFEAATEVGAMAGGATPADRKAMGSAAPRLRPGDAAGALRSHLRRLAHMLEQGPYLMGDAPSYADFCAYAPLWFVRNAEPVADILGTAPGITEWMQRVDTCSQAARSLARKGSPQQAIDIAQAAAPLPVGHEPFIDLHHIPLGSRVTVAADSFGTEPTAGELVAATRTRLTLRREDARCGTVHVHFPRIGYQLKKADA